MLRRASIIIILLIWCCSPTADSLAPPDDSGSLGRWGHDTAQPADDSVAADLSPGQDLVPPDLPPEDTAVWYEPPEHFTVVFLDIGQGDSILLQFPGGSTMLVDGGNKSAGWSTIVPYLHDLHLTRLDYVVVTHPDADHCGGLDDVVLDVDVGQVWENGQTADTWAWWDFSDAVDDQGIQRINVHRGYEEDVDGCYVQVLNANEGWGDANGNSVVLAVECEGIRVLLTGDAHSGTQEDLVDVYGTDLESDVVKVPHHGSWDRFSPFPSYVSPAVAACSVGPNNGYGHPDPEVIAEWQDVGAKFFRTDHSGHITVTIREGNLAVLTEY